VLFAKKKDSGCPRSFFTVLQVITRGIVSITLGIRRITVVVTSMTSITSTTLGITCYKYYKYYTRYYKYYNRYYKYCKVLQVLQGITVIITAAAYGYYKVSSPPRSLLIYTSPLQRFDATRLTRVSCGCLRFIERSFRCSSARLPPSLMPLTSRGAVKESDVTLG